MGRITMTDGDGQRGRRSVSVVACQRSGWTFPADAVME
jgi:hypothetical protein